LFRAFHEMFLLKLRVVRRVFIGARWLPSTLPTPARAGK